MKSNKAFTLIELLVVVLIIGILAAVALPQYQKVVEKSRATEAFQLLKTVDNAVDAYHLASGEWPKTFDELAIEIPWTGREKAYSNAISDARSNGTWSVQLEGNNKGGYYSIQATRLDGKYVGSAFVVQKLSPAAYNMPLDTYFCAEMKSGNKTFSAEEGSFCTKIIGGTFKKDYGAARIYNLPW